MIHVKWVLGEFGSVILEGQRVIPRRLLESGFVFQSPDIEKALQSTKYCGSIKGLLHSQT
jgi:NAD dependent epimerase/dehydratase family enzyme